MGLFSKKKTDNQTASRGQGSVALSDGSQVQVSTTVDCLGDSCPRPQLMTRKAMRVGGCVLNKRWIEDYFSVHVASTMCQLQSYGVNTVY